MPWNWELPNWPKFTYEPTLIADVEKKFLLGIGGAFAYLNTIDQSEFKKFMVEILSVEGAESSKIEGEILDRESLQSSIRKQFGFQKSGKTKTDKEHQMAELLCEVYGSFQDPLTHEMLWLWHSILFKNSTKIEACGQYRTHEDPMQIVSNRYGSSKVFFEAPPSAAIPAEMDLFIEWFNNSDGSILGKAAVAHVYFESLHPFEDGNGRIGRILSEKILSQSTGRPILIAISKILDKRKKEYYAALERCNRTLNIDHWVEFFASIVLQALEASMHLLYFLIEKTKLLNSLSGKISARQTKVLLRMFEEGPDGFQGGLSAEKYIAITKCSRPTATRDLIDLVKKGALMKTGELRHTRYYLLIAATSF